MNSTRGVNWRSFMDFESYLSENSIRAEITAGAVSMVLNTLVEVYEAWERAENDDGKRLARYGVLLKVSELMPVLEMLMDYTKSNKAHAEETCKAYDVLFKEAINK